MSSPPVSDMDRSLSSPPPVFSANVDVPETGKGYALEMNACMRLPMARRGTGTKGQKIPLLTNHFKVGISSLDGHFFHYSVALFYEDGSPVEQKGIGRRVLDKVQETYSSELACKNFAYDGDKSLFTIGSLPHKKLEFTVILEEQMSNSKISPDGNGSPSESNRKRSKGYKCTTFKVEVSYAARIPMQAIALALKGKESEHFQEAVRVLDIILRQNAAKRCCLLVRQAFFHNEPRNFVPLAGGVMGCRGFHSSFRATQGGLSLNTGVSTTIVVQPGPVIDFLLNNQNVREPNQIDWAKAKRTLKNLRIKVLPSSAEHKITGLSDLPCYKQTFLLQEKKGPYGNAEAPAQEIAVYDYFVKLRGIPLSREAANLPCINVGKPKRPILFPVELCELVSLQRYTKALSSLQRASLVEKSRQKPKEMMSVLSAALTENKYDAEPLLRSCGISISTRFTEVEGRILTAPKLKVGNGADIIARNGRWNFNNKKLVEPKNIEAWVVVNFSARCNINGLCRDIVKCASMKGIRMDQPLEVFEENPQNRRNTAPVRVDNMFNNMKSRLPGPPKLIVCILPEKKNSDIYGPWKRKCLVDIGVVTQCIAPTRVNDQYLTNVLLKMNAKLGGLNSLLAIEHLPSMPIVSKSPTMILGMDVSHGSPGRSNVSSIAAVVGSRQWPLVSKYRASVRTQSPRQEMIASLYMPLPDKTGDDGLIRELLVDFYTSSGQRKPEQIIIFRDGVGESQFTQVLNIEFGQILEACKLLDSQWEPKFVLIVAQKNHHTRFFQANSQDNVPPGTVIDNKVCHPRNNDFYLCSHAGMIGTTRPTHYQVLRDELGFSADDLQELVHCLSYVYQKSTTAVSVVAPICYAHLAAAQVSQFIKFDEMTETSSTHGRLTSAGSVKVQELPRLHKDVRSSMFFC